MEFANHTPTLSRIERGPLTLSVDLALAEAGVVVAFTERGGGVSEAPYRSLNLAAHVGDDAAAVDENRARTLAALHLAGLRDRLTTAEQVHGDGRAWVSLDDAGSGAYASFGRAPTAATDALLTAVPGVPLMMCFADCVPVVMVSPARAVAVVHAGWRGALSGLPGSVARDLAVASSCYPSELLTYVGPHIGACCYEVGDEIMSHFVNTFGTFARAESGGLNLGAVVRQSLTDAGVALWRITSLGVCTAETTERYFSYRAESGRTGRHAALACVLPSPS